MAMYTADLRSHLLAGFGMMDVETVARRFLQVWTPAGMDAVLEELAAPDLVVEYSHFPEPIRGRSAFRSMLEETFVAFPDLEIEADEVIVAGNRAVVRWTYRGTHQSEELYGIQPAGTRVEVRGITVYRIEDGKVTEEIGVGDTAALRAQLEEGT